MSEDRIADIIIPRLQDLGFIVHRYNAYSTNSIYIKLDYGVSCGIRISDHKGKPKYHYRFNLIKDYTGNKVIRDNNLISLYYSFCDIDSVLLAIKYEKKSKLEKYGVTKYKQLIEKESKNELFDRFKKLPRKD